MKLQGNRSLSSFLPRGGGFSDSAIVYGIVGVSAFREAIAKFAFPTCDIYKPSVIPYAERVTFIFRYTNEPVKKAAGQLSCLKRFALECILL